MSRGTTLPFQSLAGALQAQTALRAAITAHWRTPEPELIPALLQQARLPAGACEAIQQLALQLAAGLRQPQEHGRHRLVQDLLQEFALSSQEGVALMCLAEALLRIPDSATRDVLIRERIAHGHWRQHLGHSPSLFVNAASWGLLLGSRLLAPPDSASLSAALDQLPARLGAPLIRQAMTVAMRLLGAQFVAGETIEAALANATRLESQGFRYSYDMLGEAALTGADAARYLAAYEQAIHAIGRAAQGRGLYAGPGISIKLSALHPRYCRAQYRRVMDELYPGLLHLSLLARRYDIGLNIDAEEADRLELSLDLLEKLCCEPQLAGWHGIGFVVQAYQKRCPWVIDYLIELAQRSQHRLMLRLVKGAYWDSEIKRAQLDGLEGYPVYTRKPYTDLAYIACARRLLAAPEAIYPQFATHNAHSLAAIYQLAGPHYQPGQYEFQCLHGMGEALYAQVVGAQQLDRPCRIYAPVGGHDTLLAYLVRRLLENGANTSFVNRIADHSISLQDLVEDPVLQVEAMAAREGVLGLPHPRIPLPRELYGKARVNSSGLDLANEQRLASLSSALLSSASHDWRAGPLLGCTPVAESGALGDGLAVRNPADHRDIVGLVHEASLSDVKNAVLCAVTASQLWQSTAAQERAAVLERAADQMEAELQQLMGLLVREAGKTFANAIAEVREAVDFLRYYAAQARNHLSNDSHRPLGPVVCISPWNFPLAIFSGQVAAALAAGNSVLAKPAEQTPLIAAQAVRILLEAGVPAGAVQLLPGRGETVGAALIADERIRGVMFTGSTEVAGIIQRNLAGRLDAQGRTIALIAETGGQNAMIVDSSALTEQVVVDVIASAFDSAGQRCSALRVLCVQEDVAERVLTMLKGAMAEYILGNPERLNTDIGPVIDEEARNGITQHIQNLRDRGRKVHQLSRINADDVKRGTYVLPTLIELDSLAELEREIFGPVLHVVRYRRPELPQLLEQINATGYGLTLGVHTRIDETITQVVNAAHAGNLYVNRNMVGAVVGVQPFGGEGLSGTGPKAGGPLYLYRLLSTRPQDAIAGQLASEGAERAPGLAPGFDALRDWAKEQQPAIAELASRYAALAVSGMTQLLSGPTGERNSYSLLPRERVLCLADDVQDLLAQLAAALAVGCRALWVDSDASRQLLASLPQAVQERIELVADWTRCSLSIDAILHHGDSDELRLVSQQAAARPGPIIGVNGLERGNTDIALERLLIEHALSINTAAAGGNASLRAIG